MKPLDLQSERYGPTGNLASEGVLNTLGKPHMDMLAVLVREAVQNSWDAKVQGSPQVRFGIAIRTLSAPQRNHMLKTIFSHVPQSSSLREAVLPDRPFRVIELSDRGTSGLGGPTRADLPEHASEPRDFVDFLRNIGHPPDKLFGGGTFGYGKASLYAVSRQRTICVHTHAHHQKQLVARFMASAIGEGYTISSSREDRGIYTGRHWWGRSGFDDVVEPITGDQADRLALDVGMPSFNGQDDRGTTIMILDPDLGERTPEQALNVMQLTILWFFWPKMISYGSDPPAMHFDIALDGKNIQLHSPETTQPFSGYIQAIRLLKGRSEIADNNPLASIYNIKVLNPRKHLGRLSLLRTAAEDGIQLDIGSVSETDGIPDDGTATGIIPFIGRAHHVALMRQAELVVKYVPGPPLPTDDIEYTGVFLADRDMDRIYARSEPPTHDDWVHESLSDNNEKTFIRVTYRRIFEKAQEFINPTPLEGDSPETVPLGTFSNELGNLLIGHEIPGLSGRISRTSGATSRTTAASANVLSGQTKNDNSSNLNRDKDRVLKSRARVVFVDEGVLHQENDSIILKASFTVNPAEGSRATLVEIVPGIILDGGQLETDPPAGAATPRLLRWRDPDGETHEAIDRSEIVVPAESTGVWELSVEMPTSSILALDLHAREIT